MDVFELQASLELNTSGYEAGLRSAGQAAQNLGTEAENGGKQAQKGFDLASAAATALGTAAAGLATKAVSGIIDFGKQSIQTGMQFDSAMSQVAATMGTTTDAIGELRDFAKEMGATTQFSATQAAEALNYMALAGYDAQESMQMLPTVLNLASAGGMQLATASDMVTDAQTALGLSFAQTTAMVDQMAVTAANTNTSVAQLGDAILTVGGTAQYMAGGTEELSAVLGVLADNGVKGSEAGTHLRNMLLSLSSPTEKAQKTLDELGVSVFDAEGKMRSFSEIFPELNAAMDNLTDQQKLDALSQIFNTRDIASATALIGTGAERWNELAEAIGNAGGAAESMAETQLDNLEGDVTKLKSAFEGLQIEVSELLEPALRKLAQTGTEAISNLTENIGNIRTVFNSTADDLHEPEALDAWTNSMEHLIEAGMKLSSGDVIGAVKTLFSDWGGSAEEAADGSDALSGAVDNLNDSIETTPGRAAEISASITEMADSFYAARDSAIDAAEKMFSPLEQAPEIVRGSAEEVKAALDGMSSNLQSQASYWDEYANNIETALKRGVDEGLVQRFSDGSAESAKAIAELASASYEDIATVNESFQSAQEAIGKFGDAVGEAQTGVSAAVAEMASTVVDELGSASEGAEGAGENVGSGFAAGIRAKISDVQAAAAEMAAAAVVTTTTELDEHSPSKVLELVGEYVGEGLAIGIENSTPGVVNAAEGMVKSTASVYEVLPKAAKSAADQIKEALDSVEDAEKDYEKSLAAFSKDLEGHYKEIDSIQQAYYNALESRASKLENTWKLFDEVKKAEEPVDGAALIENLRGQVEALEEYGAVMASLESRGIEGALLDELRGLGPGSLAELQALDALTDKELDEYAALFGEKQALANEMALHELEELKDESNAKIQEQIDAINALYTEEAPGIVETLDAALASAFATGLPDAMAAAEAAAMRVLESMQSSLGFSWNGGGFSTKSVDFADSAIGTATAATINATSGANNAGAAASGQPMTAVIYMDGDEVGRAVLPSLISVAAANGTPITSDINI